MASYTMTIADIVEDYSHGEYFENNRDKIEIARQKLFDFSYPIFDESYRNVFETNFIRYFFMREIGFETDGLFKFNLETWLQIHMPYFNKLYESELIKYDPLINSETNTTYNKKNDRSQNDKRTAAEQESENQKGNVTGNRTSNTEQDSTGTNTSSGSNTETNTGTGSSTSNDDNFKRNIKSDTPDSRLSITTNDGQGVIEYASEIDEENQNNQNNKTSETESTTNGSFDSTSNDTQNQTSTNTQTAKEDSVNDKTKDATKNSDLTSTINDVEDYIQHRTGKIGVQTYAEMVMKYRESLLRVDMRILKEMNELFMLVY